MMITRLIANDCPQGFDCPRVYELGDGRLVVQGATVTSSSILEELELEEGESAVVIPPEIHLEAVEALGTPHPCGETCQPIYSLREGSVVVSGETVVDPDLLLALHMPDYESAVIVPAEVLFQDRQELREAI
jgi:hypothetical protein